MKTILNLQCWLICESLSVSAAYTGQNVYEGKSLGMVVIINLRHQVLFLEPIFQIFSVFFSQDDIYIDVLMGILSNF